MKSGLLKLNSLSGKDEVESYIGVKFSDENYKKFISEIIKGEINKFKNKVDDETLEAGCINFINIVDNIDYNSNINNNIIYEQLRLASEQLEYAKKVTLVRGTFPYSSSYIIMYSVYNYVLNNEEYKQLATLYAEETISTKEILEMEKVFFLKLLFASIKKTQADDWKDFILMKKGFKSISVAKATFGISAKEIFYENNLNLRDNQKIRNLKKLRHYVDLYLTKNEKDEIVNKAKRIIGNTSFNDTFKESFCHVIDTVNV